MNRKILALSMGLLAFFGARKALRVMRLPPHRVVSRPGLSTQATFRRAR